MLLISKFEDGENELQSEKILLLVGGKDETVEKAKALGLYVLLLQHPSKLSERQQELADVVVVVDYTNWTETRPIVEDLFAEYHFPVAVSLTEAGVETSGRINDLYGLGGTSFKVAELLRDKWAMRQHLAQSDLVSVGAASLQERADLLAFAERYGYPFIVKPTDGTAGVGVFLVKTAAEIEPVWSKVSQLRGTRTDRGSTLYVLQDFIIEEYIDGPEFSVESFSFNGRHVVVTVTEKFVDPESFAELGHAVPARISTAEQEQIRACVQSFLDAIGLRDGIGHTEVRLGKRGPAVVEGHNRIGGDGIAHLVKGAFDIDLTSYGLGWPFGLVQELPDYPEPVAGASTRFLISAPGNVESIDGVQEALEQPGVLTVQISTKVGATVRPLKDNWDRLGLIAVTGSDASDAINRGAELIGANIRIRLLNENGETHYAHVAEIK